jgi:hypothetical protein
MIKPGYIESFVIAPRISVQYKLAHRLGIVMSMGAFQPFGSADYRMTLTDIYSGEENSFKYRGRIHAPAISSHVSLILNLGSIGTKKPNT